MSRRRQKTASVETGPCESMRAQDTSGVLREARSDSSTRNRRDPTQRPSSGQGSIDKPEAKRSGVGRESEGFVVPMTAAAKTPLEGRDPALVTHGAEVSVRAWPQGPTTPSKKHENSGACCSPQPSTAEAPSPRGAVRPGMTPRVAATGLRLSDVRMLREKIIGQPCAGKSHARLERGPQVLHAHRST